MKVPLLDLKKQYKSIKEEILKVAEEIFESQYFILGPRVEALEKILPVIVLQSMPWEFHPEPTPF